MREYGKRYYERNKKLLLIKHKKYSKQYREKNREKIKEYCEIHKEQFKTYGREYGKEYRKTHKKQYNKWQKEYYRNNPKHKLKHSVSSLINYSLKNKKKGIHWESYVDFTQEDLEKHLEKQFLAGMTWANYGKWHIDHRIPISVFNFDSPDHIDFKRCWALENLRPMWAKENMIKHDKINKPFQPNLKL